MASCSRNLLSSSTMFNNFGRLLNYARRYQHPVNSISSRFSSTGFDDKFDDTKEYLGEQKTSPAMIAYLRRAKAHSDFMAQHTHDFQVGRRHLANMMGKDPETFSQDDIDAAIDYLFPSGLFEKRARTLMKPPEEIYPARKEAQFDENGRPYHWLFYTALPNFYNLLYDMVSKLKELDKYEDEMIRKGISAPSNTLSMSGMEWLSKAMLEKKLLERLSDDSYKLFVNLMDRFIQHPYAHLAPDYYEPLRKSLLVQTMNFNPEEPQYTKDGVAYITTKECPRKSARADVTVFCPGTGKITINGKDLNYFTNPQSKEQILFPLLFTEMMDKVDVEATVTGGGPTSQAGAVRWGIAWGLRNFVDEATRKSMIIAGLLTRDFRHRERKKPGQEGARRKFTWKKR